MAVIAVIWTYSIWKLLKRLSKHLSYEYYKHRVMLILQGSVQVLGLFLGCIYCYFLYDYHADGVTEQMPKLSPVLHWVSSCGPCTVVCFIFRPDCLFEEFNAYPEQTKRISIVQYKRSDFVVKKAKVISYRSQSI